MTVFAKPSRKKELSAERRIPPKTVTHIPLTKTSVKLFSSPTTHSYAASSDRLHLLIVSVRLLPTLSNTYLDTHRADGGRSHEEAAAQNEGRDKKKVMNKHFQQIEPQSDAEGLKTAG